MKKLFMEIMASEWINGSGWRIENSVIYAEYEDVAESDDLSDLSWLLEFCGDAEEYMHEHSVDDIKYTVRYYEEAPNYDTEPIAEFSVWLSNLR